MRHVAMPAAAALLCAAARHVFVFAYFAAALSAHMRHACLMLHVLCRDAPVILRHMLRRASVCLFTRYAGTARRVTLRALKICACCRCGLRLPAQKR